MLTKQGLSHAFNVARWRGDQQVRLLQSQNQISRLEDQVRLKKATLADKAFALFSAGGLEQEDLKTVCAAISNLYQKIKEEQENQEKIKAELPPEAPDMAYSAANPTGQKKCPKCGGIVPGKFCPKDGTPIT